MPRVSEAHRSARRQQILEASWRCFSRNGFHGTSMQDIFDESGLSAGAVYRYFPSKLDLVRATAESVAQGIGQAYGEIERSEPIPSPEDALRFLIDSAVQIAPDGSTDFGRAAIHVWAEALHQPEVGEIVREIGRGVRQRLTNIAVRWKSAGYLQADADPEDVARAIHGMLVGFVVQRHVVGDVSAEQYTAGIEALIKGSPGVRLDSERTDGEEGE